MASIPKGTRDFAPDVMVKRNYIFSTIRKTFEKFGYMPLETPSMENVETLTGKYGDEGDKLIFRILDSGEYHSTLTQNSSLNYFSKELLKELFIRIYQDIRGQDINTLSITDETIKSIIDKVIDQKIYFGAAQKVRSWLRMEVKQEVCRLVYESRDKLFKRIKKFVLSPTHLNSKDDSELRKYFYSFALKNLESYITDISVKILRKEKTDVNYNFDSKNITKEISEKALRYDLTVPFARFVVMNQNSIAFPFKRYQIQPVWRADRPQKGRYREFYQCDADVVGSDSLINEVELVQIFDEVLSNLKINVAIKINNRKILSGVAEAAGVPDRMMDMTVAIDKLDKIGKDGVVKELQERGFSDEAISKISVLFELNKSNEENLAAVSTILQNSETGKKGIEELQYIFDYTKELGLSTAKLEFDVTLARGLNYYTGAIFEVKALDAQMGSICGGGRYDDLTGIFGLPNVSGVGISFGADRIYDVMNELNLFPSSATVSTKVLFANFGTAEEKYCMGLLKSLRNSGINAEIYPEAAKMKKQFKYADDKAIPYVAIVGESELAANTVSLKNMKTGEQQSVAAADLNDWVVKSE